MIALALQNVVGKGLVSTQLPVPSGFLLLARRNLVQEGLRNEITWRIELYYHTKRQTLHESRDEQERTKAKLARLGFGEKNEGWEKFFETAWELFVTPLGLAYSKGGCWELDCWNTIRIQERIAEISPTHTPKMLEARNDSLYQGLVLLPWLPFTKMQLLGNPEQSLYQKEMEGDLLAAMIPIAETARAYLRKQGSYPPNLEALRVLLPEGTDLRDPFLKSPGDLQVKNEVGSFTIYSVGLDGEDNGGSVDDRKDIGYKL